MSRKGSREGTGIEGGEYKRSAEWERRREEGWEGETERDGEKEIGR